MNSVLNANRSGVRMERLPSVRNIGVIAEFIVVAVCTLAFLLTAGGICASLLARNAPGSRDFVEYWASGYQLVHHSNPYDRDSILRLEDSVGFPDGASALVMGNAPPALLMVLPLGFLGPRTAELLWSLFSLACLMVSVRMIWTMHARPANRLNLLGYSFGPALVCLTAGQMSLQLLLGLVLFLRWHNSRPFFAGVSLWLCMSKPQLFLPFAVVLLTWAIATRRARLLAGVAAALAVSTVVVLFLDPAVWTHYARMMSIMRYDRMAVPCLSNLLRRAISPNAMWLQYLPAALGCIWALSFFRTNRNHWDWLKHGSTLMLISVLVAPYAWITDQAVLIPALLHALYLNSSRSLVAVLALASAAIQLGLFRGGTNLLHSTLYLWTAPAWLVWYLLARRPRHPLAGHEPGVTPAHSPILITASATEMP